VFGSLVARMAPLAPSPLVKQLGKPYVAGETLAEAVQVVRALAGDHLRATVDVLGESVPGPEGAAAVADAYITTLETLQSSGLESHLSLKPSGLGSALGWDICGREIERVVRRAQELGSFVRIDMEDATTVDATLSLYRDLRAAGLTAVGVVLQSRLWRTAADAEALSPLRPNVRLCKGIYLEPPRIAMQEREAIRAAFTHVLRKLLGAGSYVGIATHDEQLVVEALTVVDDLAVPRDGYEFQMLLGVRGDLARLLARDHTVRIYVPYGPDSFAYAQRRMRENPEMAGHIARAVLRRIPRPWRGAPD
jgi:proline dehydrogenase